MHCYCRWQRQHHVTQHHSCKTSRFTRLMRCRDWRHHNNHCVFKFFGYVGQVYLLSRRRWNGRNETAGKTSTNVGLLDQERSRRFVFTHQVEALFLREMTSWPPSWKFGVKSRIWLSVNRCIYLREKHSCQISSRSDLKRRSLKPQIVAVSGDSPFSATVSGDYSRRL